MISQIKNKDHDNHGSRGLNAQKTVFYVHNYAPEPL